MNNEPAKYIGNYVLGFLCLAAFTVVLLFFTYGTAWVGIRVLPLLNFASQWTLVAVIFLFAPLAIFDRTRPFATVALEFSGALFGLTLWVWSLLMTCELWGIAPAMIGVVLGIVGIIPFAFVAMLLHTMWFQLFQFAVLAVATFACEGIAVRCRYKMLFQKMKNARNAAVSAD
jgi:hypothetical protein